jgi:ribonucleoside-diphosphate reductase alpha chain
LNQGAEEDRARDLFYALWIPDLFMKRMEENGDWSLFCPRECPGLDGSCGAAFEDLYTTYEKQGLARKTIPAQKIWTMILDAQIQTGTPYLLYKDACNLKSNQQHLGIIKSSNLCAEIVEYTSSEETAVCNLGSLALPRYVINGKFDMALLREHTMRLAENLDKVIDRNYYPTPECSSSNFRNRPIGIGVQGLADVFAKMKIAWTSEEARELNREIFENIYYAAIAQSCSGIAADGWYGSPAAYGNFQFDLWSDPPRKTPYLDWEELRDAMRCGLRNTLSIALMPTASTSQILGNNECFEPFTSNLYVRHVLAGDFVVINKYLVDDLMKRGLWTAEMRTNIMANNGSVQSLDIPADVKELYKTAWEIPQKVLINMSRDRAPFVCQSQSLNLFVSDPTYARISSMHVYAWKQGLKTGCYYLRTKAVAAAQKFTVEPDCVLCSA